MAPPGPETGASARISAGYALARAIRPGRDRRQQVGALNPILRARLFHVQNCHTQVAITGQGERNKFLKPGNPGKNSRHRCLPLHSS